MACKRYFFGSKYFSRTLNYLENKGEEEAARRGVGWNCLSYGHGSSERSWGGEGKEGGEEKVPLWPHYSVIKFREAKGPNEIEEGWYKRGGI